AGHPVESGHVVDDREHVEPLLGRVHDVGLVVGRLAEAPLVEAEDAVAGGEVRGDGTGGRRLPRSAPSVAVQHHGHGGVGAGADRLEEGGGDLVAVGAVYDGHVLYHDGARRFGDLGLGG